MSLANRLRSIHLLFIAATAAWMGLAHPGGWAPALVVAVVAGAGEALPAGVWREIAAPAVVLIAGMCGWMAGDGSRGSIHALLGTLGAALVLIPARPGALRLIAALAALELVVCGLPGVTGVAPWLAVGVLVPLATAALATDAWLVAHLDARQVAGRRPSLLHWALIPAALAALLGILAFAPAESLAKALRPPSVRQPQDPRILAGPRPPGASGDKVGVEPGGAPPRDPTPAARLFLPTSPNQLIYLRLAACSQLQRDITSGRWRWLPAPGEIEVAPEPFPTGMQRAQLVRLGGLGDSVLAPDDGGWTSLDSLSADGDGNRWRIDLGAAIRSYEVAMSGPPRRELEADLDRARAACREVPPGFDGLPWQRIEDPTWRSLAPEAAALRIAAVLQARCSYDLDLPKAPSDPLSTFLFAENARDRRGICEHFAGAAALLLRRAGHPARLVAGFASAEWDGSGVLFRRLHAHAWVEVLAEDGAWKRVDPTPSVAHSLLANLPHDDAVPPPDATQATPLAPLRSRYPTWAWWLAGTALAGLVAAVVAAYQRRRASSPVARRAARARRHGEELVRLATELGCRVASGDTAADICHRLSRRTGVDLSCELAAYQAARFGDGPEPPPWPVQALRSGRSGRPAPP